MKIGLITFHNALNYGAALQAFASQRAINKLGHDCVVIDYVNASRRQKYSMRSLISEKLKQGDFKTAMKMAVGSALVTKRGKAFQHFYTRIVKTGREYHCSAELEELNDEFDLFIAGSDQIWNPKNNGADAAYLLDFVKDKAKTASYASSFGICEVPGEYRSIYTENLGRINFLSVRESKAADIVRDLTGREAVIVLDPVFLLEKEEWLLLCAGEEKREKAFIFEYTNLPGQLEQALKSANVDSADCMVRKISRYVTPQDFLKKNTTVDYSISPERFVANIRDARFVVTASFHAAALSIILEKPFLAVLTGDAGKDSRLESLLKTAGLENRIIRPNTQSGEPLCDIDYTAVKKRLEPTLEKSISFLRQALGGNEGGGGIG